MTAPPPSLALRPLSAMEYGLWKTDLCSPLNFTTTARILGPLTAEVLRAALPALRARHVQLRTRIVVDGTGRPEFRADAVPPLELREVDGTDWVQALEHELNAPFSHAGSLARFVWLGESGHLHVTLHHAAGDGMSGVFLIRDLIEACAQVIAGETPILKALSAVDSIDAALPRASRGVNALGHHARFLLRELWVGLRSGRPIKLRHDQDLFAHASRARVTVRELDAELSERLATRARAEKTTVHGALSAAILLGVLADAKIDKGGVTFGTPVNVRSQLEPPIGEHMGVFISMVTYRAVVDARRPFWELARGVRRSIEQTIQRGDHLAMLDLLPRVLRLIGGHRLSPRALGERLEKLSVSTAGLTNLGRLKIQTRHGPLTIADCHFSAAPSALGDLLSTATSLEGRIFWNFIWPEPVLSEPHATALVDDIVARLKSAVA